MRIFGNCHNTIFDIHLCTLKVDRKFHNYNLRWIAEIGHQVHLHMDIFCNYRTTNLCIHECIALNCHNRDKALSLHRELSPSTLQIGHQIDRHRHRLRFGLGSTQNRLRCNPFQNLGLVNYEGLQLLRYVDVGVQHRPGHPSNLVMDKMTGPPQLELGLKPRSQVCQQQLVDLFSHLVISFDTSIFHDDVLPFYYTG